MTLPALGTCSYNGFTFSEKAETLAFRCVPQPDGAGRSVAFSLVTLTIRDFITNGGSSVESLVATARQQLEAWGGALTLANKGFGDLSINTGGGKWDIAWGPKVKNLEIKLVGAAQAAEITWSVEVSVPDHCASPAYLFRIMEFNYELQWSIDLSGYTQRTYTGYLRIPQSKLSVGTKQIVDSADGYRERVIPPVPTGFRRNASPGSFRLSADKCRLDFNVTDEEMPPVAPPPGVVEIEASHEVQSSVMTGQWEGVLTASYEMAKGVSPQLAWKYFIALLASRIRAAQQNGTRAPLLTKLRLAQPEVYGRKSAACSANYNYGASFAQLLEASGLWTLVPNSNMQLWQASMVQAGVWGPRGIAQMRFRQSDDQLVDLCSASGALPNGAALVANPGGQVALRIFNAVPPPEQSYLSCKSWVHLIPRDGVAVMQTLPIAPLVQQPITAPTKLTNPSSGGNGLLADVQAARTFTSVTPKFHTFQPPIPSLIAQNRATPIWEVVLEGTAIRAGYQIVPPLLTSVNNVPVMPQNRSGDGFKQGLVANFFGVPIIGARWRLRYVLERPFDGALGVPPNPVAN